MVKVIKLHEPVYNRITELLRPKESYSEVVERLLHIYEQLQDFQKVMEDAGVRFNLPTTGPANK
jgi:predicted CopG family antitoxin